MCIFSKNVSVCSDGPVHQMECHGFNMIKYSPLHVIALPIMSIKVYCRDQGKLITEPSRNISAMQLICY